MAESIRVDSSVTAVNKAAAASISAKLTADSINDELATAGLPAATVLEVAAEFADGGGSKGGTSLAGILGGAVGAVVLIMLVVGACLFHRRTRQREAPRVTEMASVELGHSSSLSITAGGAYLCCIRTLPYAMTCCAYPLRLADDCKGAQQPHVLHSK